MKWRKPLGLGILPFYSYMQLSAHWNPIMLGAGVQAKTVATLIFRIPPFLLLCHYLHRPRSAFAYGSVILFPSDRMLRKRS
ncbi:hypothetical protein IWT25_01672 [Secundilactobacillus pentosiphilus]|uniref:Uncharacterized protein n=1 Tax=Secundilactobacillus pentosiphilus TaxID=1714682 RepID=A0A1Z5IX06_9LACO|nr:hypothetical protein IWT25_01672 [Secundilactobacillus pentosiphilus]